MLIINVKEQEFFDHSKEIFFTTKPVRVQMVHSLISVAKWEAIWEKAYLPTPGLNPGIQGIKEEISYMECMIIGKVPKHVPTALYQYHNKDIYDYINSKQSATTIHRRGSPQPFSRQTITVELIYYWMIKFGIPIECERWHFNRLLMLIDVFSVKESSGKGGKLSSSEALAYRQQLNKARRAQQ